MSKEKGPEKKRSIWDTLAFLAAIALVAAGIVEATDN